jgi:hypothetical protein
MSQTNSKTQPCSNRVLHLTSQCEDVMPRVRRWAKGLGIEAKLDAALDYCRTYSKGPEEEWHSELGLDMFFNESKPSFICVVCRRVDPDSLYPTGLRHFMTIGMIWDDREQDWSFHS